jgi:opacity protein-like surface antigen
MKEAVMKRTLTLTVAIFALAALAFAAPAVQAKGGTRIVLKASSAFPGAGGKAKFQTRASASWRSRSSTSDGSPASGSTSS